MNTEIIRGNALQVLELVEEVENLRHERSHMECDINMKDSQICKLEKEVEEVKQTIYLRDERIKELEAHRGVLVANLRKKNKMEGKNNAKS